jgi:hypothetical protein
MGYPWGFPHGVYIPPRTILLIALRGGMEDKMTNEKTEKVVTVKVESEETNHMNRGNTVRLKAYENGAVSLSYEDTTHEDFVYMDQTQVTKLLEALKTLKNTTVEVRKEV